MSPQAQVTASAARLPDPFQHVTAPAAAPHRAGRQAQAEPQPAGSVRAGFPRESATRTVTRRGQGAQRTDKTLHLRDLSFRKTAQKN